MMYQGFRDDLLDTRKHNWNSERETTYCLRVFVSRVGMVENNYQDLSLFEFPQCM